MPQPKYPNTTPAPKYGPTSLYGTCEFVGCGATARVTCSVCEGDFCLGHASHIDHGGDAPKTT